MSTVQSENTWNAFSCQTKVHTQSENSVRHENGERDSVKGGVSLFDIYHLKMLHRFYILIILFGSQRVIFPHK